MALRSPHGKGKASGPAPRVEVPPADELRPGEPHSPPQPDPLVTGPTRGQFRPGDPRAAVLQSKGGRTTAQRARLAATLGLTVLPEDPTWRDYLAYARDWSEQQTRSLCEAYGEVGPAPWVTLQTAALQLAASRRAYDQGDARQGSVWGADSRQSLLAAHHLAELDWRARKGSGGYTPQDVAAAGRRR